MNEQIREILKQATQYADSLGPIDGAEWCDAEYSKFAELIVKECLIIANKEHKMALEFQWDNDDTAQSIKDSIKKHFGIE